VLEIINNEKNSVQFLPKVTNNADRKFILKRVQITQRDLLMFHSRLMIQVICFIAFFFDQNDLGQVTREAAVYMAHDLTQISLIKKEHDRANLLNCSTSNEKNSTGKSLRLF